MFAQAFGVGKDGVLGVGGVEAEEWVVLFVDVVGVIFWVWVRFVLVDWPDWSRFYWWYCQGLGGWKESEEGMFTC